MGRLFWKIFLACWLALVATAALTGSVVWLHQRAQGRIDPELAAGPVQAMVTDMAASTLRHGGVDALRAWLGEARRPVRLLVVDSSGADALGRPVPPAALARARSVAASAPSSPVARVVEAPDGRSYLLFVPLSAEPRRPRPPPRWSPWLLLAVGAVSSLAVSAFLAWHLARPIRHLRWAFGAASRGHLEVRVRPLMGGRRDEIADLGQDFDGMAQQLEALVSAQRRLLHDVSHELRSPLARLQAATGLLRQDPAKLEASLDRIERETTRLDDMIAEVLTLSRLEAGTMRSAEEIVDLAELVASVARDASFEAQAANRMLTVQVPGAAPIRGRADLLHRAVENVIRNAIKYTAERTAVEVELSVSAAEPRSATVTVRDYGPGIPPEELDKVFLPFYRSSAQSMDNGFGLGLAIAHQAITLHGGTIAAANVAGGGLKIEIRLPLAPGAEV